MHSREDRGSRPEKTVLIYDGSCPICSNTVAWIKAHEQKDAFELLPCQSPDRKDRYPDIKAETCMEAMQLVLPGGSVLAGEKAIPEIFKRLKRFRAAAALFKLPGSGLIARASYRWFADRRYFIAKMLFPPKHGGQHRDKAA